MTYRQLAQQILKMNEKQLDSDVTIFDTYNDEFFPAESEVYNADKHCDGIKSGGSVLDEGHPYLIIRN